MNHIMLDLETMSTDPNAAIVSIGAVAIDFENNRLGEEFYRRISLESAMQSGGIVDASTVIWWLQQSEPARREIYSATADIRRACEAFTQYVSEIGDPAQMRIWGDGAAFDNVLLSCTYKRIGLERPWKFWNDRCYRTIKNTYKDIKAADFGTAHNALDDAKAQALHLLNIFKLKNPGVNA
jgi:hypothetical protein